MDLRNSDLKSSHFRYAANDIYADTSEFNLKSLYTEGFTVLTENINSHISFSDQKGWFRSNEDYTLVTFPDNRYISYLNYFMWDMRKKTLALGAPNASPEVVVFSLAPKSVTAPVAMGISERVGGLPSLTAVLVVMTGILGAVLGSRIFDLLRIRDDSIRGVAMGVTSHGIGTARAFQISTEMGAFSGLAMALSALVSSLVLPGLLRLVAHLV